MVHTCNKDRVSSTLGEPQYFSSWLRNFFEVHKGLCSHFLCQSLSLGTCVDYNCPQAHGKR